MCQWLCGCALGAHDPPVKVSWTSQLLEAEVCDGCCGKQSLHRKVVHNKGPGRFHTWGGGWQGWRERHLVTLEEAVRGSEGRFDSPYIPANWLWQGSQPPPVEESRTPTVPTTLAAGEAEGHAQLNPEHSEKSTSRPSRFQGQGKGRGARRSGSISVAIKLAWSLMDHIH